MPRTARRAAGPASTVYKGRTERKIEFDINEEELGERLPPVVRDTPGVPFSATYPGSCSNCGRRFAAGEMIRADGAGTWAAIACCGEVTLDDNEVDAEAALDVDLATVMPKVRHPMCTRCFQIPASNGICGC